MMMMISERRKPSLPVSFPKLGRQNEISLHRLLLPSPLKLETTTTATQNLKTFVRASGNEMSWSSRRFLLMFYNYLKGLQGRKGLMNG